LKYRYINYWVNVISTDNAFKYTICKAKVNEENECDVYVIPKWTLYSVGVLNCIKENYKLLCIDKNNIVIINTVDNASYLIDGMIEVLLKQYLHE